MRSKEPDKTIPRATFGFIAVTGATYALSVWVIIQAIGSQDAGASTGADPTGAMRATMQEFAEPRSWTS
jgi:amino acid transporter